MASAATGDLPQRKGGVLNHSETSNDDGGETITPVTFTPSVTPASREDTPRGRYSPTVLFGLGSCVLLAIAVVVLLPRWIEPRLLPKSSTTETPNDIRDAPHIEAPVIDSAARRAAQDALARVQKLRVELEAAAVEHWAAEPFATAQADAERGALSYRAQDYAMAQSAYEKAAHAFAELRAQIEPRIERALTAAEAALAAGDGAAAHQAFTSVLAMAPDHPQAQVGLARVATLPRVRQLNDQGEQRLASGDASGAADAFQSALALDSADTAARQGAQRAAQMAAQQRYQTALDAGYTALQEQRYTESEQLFTRALALRPNAREARDGLTEVRSRVRITQMNQSLDAARQAVAAERWAAAVAQYRAALSLDDAVIEAQQGLETASARVDLDNRLTATLAAPQRLGSAEVQRATQALLSEAQSVPEPGPRLRGQILALEQALATARIPVSVTLHSDGKTEVTVLRIGALGNFEHRTVELPPGDYVAHGERAGYRDVRVPFAVRADTPPPTVVVRCQEPI